MNPLIIAAAVFGGVYFLTRGAKLETGPGGLPLPTPGGTMPETGTNQPGTSPPGGEIGGVPHDPGVVPPGGPGQQGSSPCTGCGGGISAKPMPTGPQPKPAVVLTAPKPPARDHRGERPVHTVKVKPRSTVACIKAPCPSTPKGGQSDPHHTSIAIVSRLSGGPVTW